MSHNHFLSAAPRHWLAKLVMLVVVATPAWQVWGAEFHVSPRGNALGDGGPNHPWDLQTALDGAPGKDRQPRIRPGDAVWLHGGVYRGGFSSRLLGRLDAPITVRQAPGERATIECALIEGRGEPYFLVEGGHAIYWGFEVTCADLKRETTHTGSWPADIRRGGVLCRGSDVKFINLIVHDLGSGIGFWSEAEGGEIYGCLIYYNGWKGPERGHGHGIYAQNKDGEKRLVDNVIFNQFGYGIHCYGTEKAFLRGFHIEGNAGFNNGCLHKLTDHNPVIFVGGGAPVQGLTVSHNYIYGGSLSCGYPWGAPNQDVSITDNYIEGSLSVRHFLKVVATGNTLIANDTLVGLQFADKIDTSQYDWDHNHYFRPGGMYPPFNWQAGPKVQGGELDEWRAAAKLDAHSDLHAAAPPNAQGFVRPNRYEPGRAHIIVFNPGRTETVEVDLSAAMKVGQKYTIVSVQNVFGPPVCTGVYQGQAISLPMKPTPAAQPIGMAQFNLPVTEPAFGVFLAQPSP